MTQLAPSAAAWVRFYERRDRENFGPPRPGLRPSSRARVLDVIRCASPAAFQAIVNPPAPVRSVRDPSDGSVIEVAEVAK
jgi:hypothetical protein